MKILYCTDLHIKGKNPCNRLDNYYESCLSKLDEIISIANKNKCEFVLCGGDVFDSPNVSNTVIDDFMDRIEASKKPWYITPGNHDLIGHNWELSKASALAHIFRRSKKINKKLMLEDDEIFEYNQSTYIEMIEYNHNIENNLKENGLITNSKADFKIAVVHAFITIKPFFKDVSHICAKDLNTNYDVILCSHFHMEFDEVINGTRFINPNSIGRTSIKERHQPQILILDTVTREIEKIQLKSAKPANQIFDLAKYNELKGQKKGIEDFISSLKNLNFQGMEIGTQIVNIGKKDKKYDKAVKYLLDKIGD